MIHYHGTPMTPDKAAAEILRGRHGLVSFAHPGQVELVAEVCQSFVFDSGAYSVWRSRRSVEWMAYYKFVDAWSRHPGLDWALIPDVIDGTAEQNDQLIEQWPFQRPLGVPIWHLHEPLGRLFELSTQWPRVALGSSGAFAQVGTSDWWARIDAAMDTICVSGQPATRLHGLRMLNANVFTRLPLASADSCNVARNIGLDKRWGSGAYPPPTKAARGIVLATRIENYQSLARRTP